jgi:predicted DNA-binding transcriptional regulator AlpA
MSKKKFPVPSDDASGGRAKSAPAMLDVQGFADVLGVSTRSIRRLVDAGKAPPPVRLSRRLPRWPKLVIEAWVQAGCPKIRTVREGGAR